MKRIESDSMGNVEVESSKYWGAQTQRSLEHFSIGREHFTRELIWSLGIIKKSCAQINYQNKILDFEHLKAISLACDEVINGKLDEHFPLFVWQTGSGTQTNMNMNEVIANRACELLEGERGDKSLVHPNDHVKMSQSSNDVFPTAMNLACLKALNEQLLPSLTRLIESYEVKIKEFSEIIKIGRTHLMDATPLTLGAEFSGHQAALIAAKKRITTTIEELSLLAIGGSAVGTGLNTPPNFGADVAREIAKLTGYSTTTAPNKYMALAGNDAINSLSSALKGLANTLFKLANDIRWLASGPRAGLNELILPANEPGSSIMPGKVNPTQCEALTMVCLQVMGNDVSISMASASGNFELNVYRPLIIYNILQSLELLSQSMENFEKYCLRELAPNKKQIEQSLKNSLMLVTALSPHIGYDKASELAKYAYEHDMDLRSAADSLGIIKASEFDRIVDPRLMLGN